MTFSYNWLVKTLERDMQPMPFEIAQWREANEGAHPSDEYDLAELCEGVKDGEVPYSILWLLLRYYEFKREDILRIVCGALNIDIYLYDTREVRNVYDVHGKCKDIESCESINDSEDVSLSSYVKNSKNVNSSKYVADSQYVSGSKRITRGYEVLNSTNVNRSSFIHKSEDINGSYYITSSSNVGNSIFCFGCENFSHGLFCAFIKNEVNKFYIFNKEVSEEEFKQITSDLLVIFDKFFEHSKGFASPREMNDFKEYCSLIPGYDEVLFNYLMESIFRIWKPIITGR